MLPRPCGVPVVTNTQDFLEETKRRDGLSSSLLGAKGLEACPSTPLHPSGPALPLLPPRAEHTVLRQWIHFWDGTSPPFPWFSLPPLQPFSVFIFLALNLPAGSSQVSVCWRKKAEAFRQMVSCHSVGMPQADMGPTGLPKQAGWHAQCKPPAEAFPSDAASGRRSVSKHSVASGQVVWGLEGLGSVRDRGGRPVLGSAESRTAEARARRGLVPLCEVPSLTLGFQAKLPGCSQDRERGSVAPASRELPAKGARKGERKQAASEAFLGFLKSSCCAGKRLFCNCENTGLIFSGSLSGALARG